MRLKTLFRSGTAVIGLVSLTACGIRPQPMTMNENITRAVNDRSEIQKHYVPLATPELSLEQAIARALAYNYQIEVAKLEITQQEKQLDLSLTNMLPQLAADAGYTTRNNNNAAESIDEFTNQRSLDYSYSEVPTHGTADVQFSWDLTDIGVSYFQARQQGYRALIAVERRRRAINTLVRNTAEVYWRARAAQAILPKIDPMIADARVMLDNSKHAADAHLQNPLILLDYQQNVMQLLRQLYQMRNDLVSAQIQLRSFINVAPGTPVTLITSDEVLTARPIQDMAKLEEITLVMRPELREESYQQKISRQDIYAQIVRMSPGVGALGSENYDTNKLLYNNVWGQVGVRATFNLMNLIRGPRAIAVAHSAIDASRARQMALSVSLIAETNLSAQQYLNSLDMLASARQTDDIGKQMETVATRATQAGAQSGADMIRHEMAGLIAEVDYARTLAQTHGALANLYNSVGLDIVPANADLSHIDHLTAQVARSITAWKSGVLPDMTLANNSAAGSATPAQIIHAPAAPPPIDSHDAGAPQSNPPRLAPVTGGQTLSQITAASHA
ncbi:TolC family protein [Asaia siamensis]|uniref:Outer membrane protein TolC n=1 Tax=Asaia siamensis TaxID=110479 RepID=A0ABQ1LZM9_9PROT|nr:TolC family protein [Asaia siamensis]GBR10096.1 outer membrane efflux protein [Asaia siamensis NRIC 0323]GGC32589.1 hypothetical protein GCM10007207_17600 [Asaia siamensis]